MASTAKFDPEGLLCEGDVALDDLQNLAVVQVHIKASKTDPFRLAVFVLSAKLTITSAEWQPLLPTWLYVAELTANSSGLPLSREAFVKCIWKALSASGMDISGYSDHSFRIRGATAAAAAGLEDPLIKTLGRWCKRPTFESLGRGWRLCPSNLQKCNSVYISSVVSV